MDTSSSKMADTDSDRIPTTVKEGWMNKNEDLKTWLLTYCILRSDGLLSCYKNERHQNPAAEQATIIRLNIKQCTVNRWDDSELQGFLLSCHDTKNQIIFSADSEKERNEWFVAINSILDKLSYQIDKTEDRSMKKEAQKISLADYEFIHTLGKGAFGKVMLCKKTFTNKFYAIKLLKKTLLVKEKEIEHILTENEVLRSINHPFLISLKCSFQTDHFICFVMEYANGGDLFFHISQEGLFSEEKSKFYAAETILAISYLHSLGIIYRDLKTENMVLDKDGHLKIIDFGLCKRHIRYGQGTETFCGTPEYLAPEIVQGLQYGQAIDWWGVGVVIYEMICGRLPFYNENYEILDMLILMAPVEFPEHVSLTARQLLTGLLMKNPRERLGGGPSSATEIKNHIFFAGTNWKALEEKRVRPPFVPKILNPTDVTYIDPDFKNERLTLTFPSEQNTMTKDYFQDFSFDEFESIENAR